MALPLSPFENDADLKESREYCQARICQLRADFMFVRGEIKRIKRDPKRLHQVVGLWARTFRRCEAACVEIEATRRMAPTMSGLETPRQEIGHDVVKNAIVLLTVIGTVRKRLDEADLPTINRLSRDSALVDVIRVEAIAVAKPGLTLNLGVVVGGMT
jgi:hypothetical protein